VRGDDKRKAGKKLAARYGTARTLEVEGTVMKVTTLSPFDNPSGLGATSRSGMLGK
jgi:hypothetical protein